VGDVEDFDGDAGGRAVGADCEGDGAFAAGVLADRLVQEDVVGVMAHWVGGLLGPQVRRQGVAVAGTAYLFNRPPDNPGFNAGNPALRTPSAAATPGMCDPDPSAKYHIANLGGAGFSAQLNSNPSVNVKFWQLQGWRIAAGATAEYTATDSANATDFVLSGFYRAKFGSEAMVRRHIEPGENAVLPNGGVVQPGVPIDLTYSDSVSFYPSMGVEIVNLSTSVDIVFKRALFIASESSTKPVVDGARTVIDAQGRIPPAILTKSPAPNTMSLLFLPYGWQLPCDYGNPLGKPAGALVSGPNAGYYLIVGFGG
jgi:hypothetical protein